MAPIEGQACKLAIQIQHNNFFDDVCHVLAKGGLKLDQVNAYQCTETMCVSIHSQQSTDCFQIKLTTHTEVVENSENGFRGWRDVIGPKGTVLVVAKPTALLRR